MAENPWTDGRLMSFALTRKQLLDGTKTVTRRAGWKTLRVGTRLRAVNKSMGLRRGERPEVLAVIEIVSVRREPLSKIDDADAAREGFPGLTAGEFVDFFTSKLGGDRDQELTRIEFKIVWRPEPQQLGLLAAEGGAA